MNKLHNKRVTEREVKPGSKLGRALYLEHQLIEPVYLRIHLNTYLLMN